MMDPESADGGWDGLPPVFFAVVPDDLMRDVLPRPGRPPGTAAPAARDDDARDILLAADRWSF